MRLPRGGAPLSVVTVVDGDDRNACHTATSRASCESCRARWQPFCVWQADREVSVRERPGCELRELE